MHIKKSDKGNLQHLKDSLVKESDFIKTIFSVLSVPSRLTDDTNNQDDMYVYVNPKKAVKIVEEKSLKRAQSIVDLQQRLEKVKQDHNFTIKNKLIKKSLTTKLSKKAKKAERKLQVQKKNKTNSYNIKKEPDIKPENSAVHQGKPVFNSDGKLVFSKFDFTDVGKKNENKNKNEKHPKKLLNNLKKQDDMMKKLQESGKIEKVAELKEKIAWKNALAKADGEKVKDDALLLKKSVKRMDQKKKQSKKAWDERIKNLEQGKQERQKKRQENINKKKKEKKSKKIKQSAKKGRIVI